MNVKRSQLFRDRRDQSFLAQAKADAKYKGRRMAVATCRRRQGFGRPRIR